MHGASSGLPRLAPDSIFYNDTFKAHELHYGALYSDEVGKIGTPISLDITNSVTISKVSVDDTDDRVGRAFNIVPSKITTRNNELGLRKTLPDIRRHNSSSDDGGGTIFDFIATQLLPRRSRQ